MGEPVCVIGCVLSTSISAYSEASSAQRAFFNVCPLKDKLPVGAFTPTLLLSLPHIRLLEFATSKGLTGSFLPYSMCIFHRALHSVKSIIFLAFFYDGRSNCTTNRTNTSRHNCCSSNRFYNNQSGGCANTNTSCA